MCGLGAPLFRGETVPCSPRVAFKKFIETTNLIHAITPLCRFIRFPSGVSFSPRVRVVTSLFGRVRGIEALGEIPQMLPLSAADCDEGSRRDEEGAEEGAKRPRRSDEEAHLPSSPGAGDQLR